MGNLVAIVGRPNVGKSTLFNRLTKSRRAIVNEEAGTTRDRQYGKSEWLGREFSVVDTGGWVVNSDDIFEEEIRKQVLLAVDEADVILFVVDVMNGVTDLDMQVATILRRANSPVIVVANKTDNNELQYNAPEFYKLGLGDPYCISAITGSGTGDLMDLIVGKFKKESSEILDDEIPRFAANLDGLEATKIIRELSATVPIIAQSAFAYEQDRKAAEEAGCNDFIAKPIADDKLKAMIHKWLLPS